MFSQALAGDATSIIDVEIDPFGQRKEQVCRVELPLSFLALRHLVVLTSFLAQNAALA